MNEFIHEHKGQNAKTITTTLTVHQRVNDRL